MLPVVVIRSSSDCIVIRYVLLVLWMTSCFHIMRGIGQDDAYVSSSSSGGGTWREGAKSAVSDCILFQFGSWGNSDGEISCDEKNGT